MTYLSTSNAYTRDPHQSASNLGGDVGKGNRTYHAARQASGHEGKADKEEEARAPDRVRVAEALFSADAVLVDQIDDEDAEEGAQAGDPVCEGDVHGYGIVRLVIWRVGVGGEDGGIKEGPKSE
jgi:hypothetical protein